MAMFNDGRNLGDVARNRNRDGNLPNDSGDQNPSGGAPMRSNTTLNRAARLGTPTEDEQLLRKPAPAPADFTRSDTWRVLRIMGEFVSGFDTLAEVGGAVAIFGSARVKPEDPMYEAAVELAHMLAERGFAIITGGGPGIMEAANKQIDRNQHRKRGLRSRQQRGLGEPKRSDRNRPEQADQQQSGVSDARTKGELRRHPALHFFHGRLHRFTPFLSS
jgi:hypothetical protein